MLPVTCTDARETAACWSLSMQVMQQQIMGVEYQTGTVEPHLSSATTVIPAVEEEPDRCADTRDTDDDWLSIIGISTRIDDET